MAGATIIGDAVKVAKEGFKAGRLIIQAGSSSAGRGVAVPLPLPQAQGIALGKKVKVATKEDGTRLVKVSDAIECVEQYISNGGVLTKLGSSILQNIVNQSLGEIGFARANVSIVDTLVTPIAKCIRSKALKQKKRVAIPMVLKSDLKGLKIGGRRVSLKTALNSRNG